jgi:hypothetical protein
MRARKILLCILFLSLLVITFFLLNLEKEPSHNGRTVTQWAEQYRKRHNGMTRTYHVFLPFAEWPVDEKKEEPELNALLQIGLPALPILNRLREYGTVHPKLYWKFWRRIPPNFRKHLAQKPEPTAEWTTDMIEMMTILITTHRGHPRAQNYLKPLFKGAVEIEKGKQFRNGQHIKLLAAAALDEPEAESYLLPYLNAQSPQFIYESGSASAALLNPSTQIVEALFNWAQDGKPEKREVAHEALAFISRNRPDVEDRLWKLFISAPPENRQYWRWAHQSKLFSAGFCLRMNPKLEEWKRASL